MGGGGGFSVCRNFFFRSLLMHEFFFRVKPSARIFFLVDRHYFLAFFSMFNNRYVYGMQYAVIHAFVFSFLKKKKASISCLVDGTWLVACFGCNSCWLWVVDGRKILNKTGGSGRAPPGKFRFSAPRNHYFSHSCRNFVELQTHLRILKRQLS